MTQGRRGREGLTLDPLRLLSGPWTRASEYAGEPIPTPRTWGDDAEFLCLVAAAALAGGVPPIRVVRPWREALPFRLLTAFIMDATDVIVLPPWWLGLASMTLLKLVSMKPVDAGWGLLGPRGDVSSFEGAATALWGGEPSCDARAWDAFRASITSLDWFWASA